MANAIYRRQAPNVPHPMWTCCIDGLLAKIRDFAMQTFTPNLYRVPPPINEIVRPLLQENDPLFESLEQFGCFHRDTYDLDLARQITERAPFGLAGVHVESENHLFHQEECFSRKITLLSRSKLSLHPAPEYEIERVACEVLGADQRGAPSQLALFYQTGHTLTLYCSFDGRFIHIEESR